MFLRRVLCIAFLSLMFIACGGRKEVKPLPPGTQVRPIEALPPVVYSDIITVAQFRSVCDRLARSLVVQPFVQQSPRPPVITIRQLQNKTNIGIDKSIFQETIRARLMENSAGRVLFRDDVSYRDIMEERLRQSDNEVTVTVSDSIIESKARDKLSEQEFDSGFLSGIGGSDSKSYNNEIQHDVEFSQSGSIKSKVAEADYFLRGIIYQIKEQNANNDSQGMSYFQFQFRVVDARNGLIVWEKMLDSKMQGAYQPLNSTGGGATAGANVGQGGGQQPWPPVNNGISGATNEATNNKGAQNTQNQVNQGGAQNNLKNNSPIPSSIGGTGALKQLIKKVGKSFVK